MRESLTLNLQANGRPRVSDRLAVDYPLLQVPCQKPGRGLVRSAGGALLMSILLPISSFSAAPAAAAAPKPPPDPEWEAAAKLFKQRHWADAEKAFVKYARRLPPPSRRAEALVMVGRARVSLKDGPGARRQFEAAIREPGLRRAEPEAVAEAFDRLHRLLLDEGKSSSQRQRLLDDFKRSLPQSPLLSTAHEREADALLISRLPQDALKLYNAAEAGLSHTGTNIVILLRTSLTTSPAPLTNDDLKLQLAASRTRPQVADGLAAVLAQRKEGWRAEDIRTQLLLEEGKPAAAVTAWEAMLKSRRGPADQIALARAAALATIKASDGAVAYGEWLAAYPQSPLREQAARRATLCCWRPVATSTAPSRCCRRSSKCIRLAGTLWKWLKPSREPREPPSRSPSSTPTAPSRRSNAATTPPWPASNVVRNCWPRSASRKLPRSSWPSATCASTPSGGAPGMDWGALTTDLARVRRRWPPGTMSGVAAPPAPTS